MTERNKCTALVLLDSSQVRKKYISECKRARTTYQKARQELDVYEKQNKPAFNQWLHAQLGPELTTIRQLQNQYRGKQDLCRRIILESQLSGSSMYESYKRIKNGETEMKDKFHQAFEDESEEDVDPFEEEADKEFAEAFSEFEEQFRRFFFGQEGNQDETWAADDDASENQTGSAAKKRKLKSVYRDVCRRLHPDAEGEETSEELEIWHQVQEAYQQEDLDRLEFLRAKTDIAQNGINQNTPVSHIQQMTNEYKEARASLRSLIRRARQEEAWDFSRWSKNKTGKVLKNYRRFLKEEKAELKEELEEMEDFLNELEDLIRAEEEAIDELNKSSQDHHEPQSKYESQGTERVGAAWGRQKTRSGRKEADYDPDQMEFDFT